MFPFFSGYDDKPNPNLDQSIPCAHKGVFPMVNIATDEEPSFHEVYPVPVTIPNYLTATLDIFDILRCEKNHQTR